MFQQPFLEGYRFQGGLPRLPLTSGKLEVSGGTSSPRMNSGLGSLGVGSFPTKTRQLSQFPTCITGSAYLPLAPLVLQQDRRRSAMAHFATKMIQAGFGHVRLDKTWISPDFSCRRIPQKEPLENQYVLNYQLLERPSVSFLRAPR